MSRKRWAGEGVGGIGEVFRAHDSRLGRDVALKVLSDSFRLDTHRRARFEREALYKSRELGTTEAINRGLIIRQLTGYHDAPLKGRSIRDLAKPGSKL